MIVSAYVKVKILNTEVKNHTTKIKYTYIKYIEPNVQ